MTSAVRRSEMEDATMGAVATETVWASAAPVATARASDSTKTPERRLTRPSDGISTGLCRPLRRRAVRQRCRHVDAHDLTGARREDETVVRNVEGAVRAERHRRRERQ